MGTFSIALLLAGGLAAGVVNTMAGGGSLLTVPLLVLAGVPGNVANGSNRIGILASTAAATATFRSLGFSGWARVLPVLVPVATGSVVGAVLVGRLADETFEQVFGFLMVPIVILSLRLPAVRAVADGEGWSGPLGTVVFLGIGVKTKVLFCTLDDWLIDWYVSTDESIGKAGGYGIQGRASMLVEAVNGSFTNVVGLPMMEVTQTLRDFGVLKE